MRRRTAVFMFTALPLLLAADPSLLAAVHQPTPHGHKHRSKSQKSSHQADPSKLPGAPVAGPRSSLDLPPETPYTTRMITLKDVQEAKKANLDVFTYLFGELARTVRRFNGLDPKYAWAGKTIKVPDFPPGEEWSPMPPTYAPAASLPKYILVSLQLQFMGLYENGQLVASYPICSGRPGHRTPTLTFKVGGKNKDMKSNLYPEARPGHKAGGAPMPWASQIKDGFWFHGGDMMGTPSSHGCVRMFAEDAKAVFEWDELGTPGRIVDPLK